MPFTNLLVATCECGATTAVTEVYWPATRIDPADGEIEPTECSGCGAEFDSSTKYEKDEPPDPTYEFDGIFDPF